MRKRMRFVAIAFVLITAAVQLAWLLLLAVMITTCVEALVSLF